MKTIQNILASLAVTFLTACTHNPFLTSIDPNYTLDMQRTHHTWSQNNTPIDTLTYLAHHGINACRIRLWTADTGTNSLADATELARRATSLGLKIHLVLFLSDNWADLVKQPAPIAWAQLPQPEKLAAIQAYTRRVTQHFLDNHIPIDLVEIGNEIDFGICGVFEESWPHRTNLHYMQQTIWPHMLPILHAAEAGVRDAQPHARFLLHLAQWTNADYCIAFTNFMKSHDIHLDILGLTYFPTSATDPAQRPLPFLQKQIAAIHAHTHTPMLICESGYPTAPHFNGQFAAWNNPAPTYPLTETGQSKWLHDYLKTARSTPHLLGITYWSPEWYTDLWQPFALFDQNGNARPALNAFK